MGSETAEGLKVSTGSAAATGSHAITIERSPRHGSLRRAAVVAGAGIIEVVLILGLVAATVGLGHEGSAGVGPDRPLMPRTAAPEARPEPGLP
jgi:hypothetical protein